MSIVPSISPDDHAEALLGTRGIQVRLTFASGGAIERKYALLGGDDTGYVTRAFAIGDLLAIHASGSTNALHVPDARYHEIDLTDFDPIVEVNVQNVRITE